MPRRSKYSNVNKTNQIRAPHVKGMGDVSFQRISMFKSLLYQFYICPRR